MNGSKKAAHNENINIDGRYDVIIVGAGIAGIISAAYTAKAGLTTLLCEKSQKPGGLVGSFSRRGFTFDSGIRAFENSGIVFPMLRQLGIELEFVRNPVRIGLEEDSITISGTENLADYADLLSKKFPENRQEIEAIIGEIRKVTGYMDVLYGIENPLFMDLSGDRQYLFKTLLPWLFDYQLKIRKAQRLSEPIENYLLRFTSNQALIDVIIQHFFARMPTFFALSYFGLYSDYSYPTGGTGVLVSRLMEFFTAQQGKVALNTEIIQIDIEGQQVLTGNGQCFGYSELIWCGDMKTLYGIAEMKTEEPSIREQKKRIAGNCGGDSIFTLFLEISLDQGYFEKHCGPHCFYTPSRAGLSAIRKEHWQMVLADQTQPQAEQEAALKAWITEYLQLTTYEISCPALRDPTLAPAGKTGVIVSTLFDYQLVKAIDQAGWYADFKNLCEETITAVLEQSLFPGWAGQIEERFSSTPLTIERITGNTDGAITGWAFLDPSKTLKLPSVSRFRKIAQAIKTPLPHLHQAGQWTFSPAGLPVSILTGKLAADAVIKIMKKKRSKDHFGDEPGEQP
jgi:phytoene dehydrogenase-like protein